MIPGLCSVVVQTRITRGQWAATIVYHCIDIWEAGLSSQHTMTNYRLRLTAKGCRITVKTYHTFLKKNQNPDAFYERVCL